MQQLHITGKRRLMTRIMSPKVLKTTCLAAALVMGTGKRTFVTQSSGKEKESKHLPTNTSRNLSLFKASGSRRLSMTWALPPASDQPCITLTKEGDQLMFKLILVMYQDSPAHRQPGQYIQFESCRSGRDFDGLTFADRSLCETIHS